MDKKIPLKINIFDRDGNKSSGYQVICQQNVILRFNYMGKVHTERVLSDFEGEFLKKKIRGIKLDLFPEDSIEMCKILPDITTLVEINNSFNKISICWRSSDELNHKKSFSSLIKFIETVREMLEVDTSKLNLPFYE